MQARRVELSPLLSPTKAVAELAGAQLRVDEVAGLMDVNAARLRRLLQENPALPRSQFGDLAPMLERLDRNEDATDAGDDDDRPLPPSDSGVHSWSRTGLAAGGVALYGSASTEDMDESTDADDGLPSAAPPALSPVRTLERVCACVRAEPIQAAIAHGNPRPS